MPDLLERRKRDLLQQFEVLPLELKHWEDVSESAQPFEKHHSQIRALAAQMRALNERVKSGWKESDEFGAIQVAQQRCATVQAVWNYFREKLVLRLDAHLGRYLKAADAYAWACYEPVLVAHRSRNPESAYREPPLVTFHAEVAPSVLSRQSRYDTDDAAGLGGEEAFEQARSALPIPVIGIAWQNGRSLAHMPVLAHETGHIIESDFRLDGAVAAEVRSALAGSPLVEGWAGYWRKEVFADVFACYAAGPSYGWALADALPESPAVVAKKRRPTQGVEPQWGQYPPATLRILLVTAALSQFGFGPEAKLVEDYWRRSYPEHPMKDSESEPKVVAAAVSRAMALPGELGFSRLDQQVARARRLADGETNLALNETFNPRALVAVGSEAQRQPALEPKIDRVWEKLIDHMVLARPPGVLDGQKQRAKTFAPTRTDELSKLLFGESLD